MKKNIMLFLLLLAFMLPAIAHDFEVDGIYYNKKYGTEVTVTYRGTSTLQYDEYSGDIIIPATVTYAGISYSVTSIGPRAFYECRNLTSIDLPNSITSIDEEAFVFCEGLTNVIIGNSVTSIGDYAFYGCRGLTSIDIPNSVTSIGNYALCECSGLTSITIGKSVTAIGNYVLGWCESLTSIQVASGNPVYDSRNNCNAIIEKYGNTLIAGCISTVIPNSVNAIGDYAFWGCSGLTNINIPNSVAYIGNESFYGCI